MDLPSNSHSAKAKASEPESPKKEIKKVVTGEVVVRKPNLGKRFSGVFFGADAKTTLQHVLTDVVLPSTKELLSNSFKQGVDYMLFGDGRRSTPSAGGYTNYQRISGTGAVKKEEPRPISKRARARHDFDEIVFPTRVEANDVLEQMHDIINQYGTTTVADFYQMAGVSDEYPDVGWGWTDLRGSGVSQVRGGYVLDIPRPRKLD